MTSENTISEEEVISETERNIRSIWIYSGSTPEAIARSLEREDPATSGYIVRAHSSGNESHYEFKRPITASGWENFFIGGSITTPDEIDTVCYEHFLGGKTYGLQELNSKIKITNGAIKFPEAIIPTLKPVLDRMKKDQINFIATVVGYLHIHDLVGYHINGKTHKNPEDKDGLVDLIK